MGKSSKKNVTTFPVAKVETIETDWYAIAEELEETLVLAYESRNEKYKELIDSTTHRIADCADLFKTGKALVDAANGLRVFRGVNAEIPVETAVLVCMKVETALNELMEDWCDLINCELYDVIAEELDGWLDSYIKYDINAYITDYDAVAGHLLQESVQAIWSAMARIIEFHDATLPEIDKMLSEYDDALGKIEELEEGKE